jgi:hypothetical protein
MLPILGQSKSYKRMQRGYALLSNHSHNHRTIFVQAQVEGVL